MQRIGVCNNFSLLTKNTFGPSKFHEKMSKKKLKNGRPTLVPHFGNFYNIIAKDSSKVKYLHTGSTLADHRVGKYSGVVWWI
jgi:hypothetical protein